MKISLDQAQKIPKPEDLEAQNLSQAAILYLQSTDWMVIRQLETMKPVPPEVLKKRVEARSKVIEVTNETV